MDLGKLKAINLCSFLSRHYGVEIDSNGQGHCPFHDDKNPSLSVYLKAGSWYWKCHANGNGAEGCGGGSIIDFVIKKENLSVGDAIMRIEQLEGIIHIPLVSQKPGFVIVRTHAYVDENGAEVWEKIKLSNGTFRCRRKDGDQWTYNLKGIKPIPYRLDRIKDEASIVICEGEKDAETLTALGFQATTGPYGKGSWPDELTPFFAGKEVRICYDVGNDADALAVAQKLSPGSPHIFILHVPLLEYEQDITDYLEKFETEEAKRDAFYEILANEERFLPDAAQQPKHEAAESADRDASIPSAASTPSPENNMEFSGITVSISDNNWKAAAADIGKLKVSPKTKRMILTGETRKEQGKDGTKSARDMSILCGLVAAGYGYKTAEAIFLNKCLPCSDRILGDSRQAEAMLRHDFCQAVKYLRKERVTPTPQIRAIQDIKATGEISAEEKLRRIRKYIVHDLFDMAGTGFKNEAQRKKFFFDKSKKMLLDVGGDDFKCFLRDRYDLPEKDMVEVLAGIETCIWNSGTEIEPFNFARYDDSTGVLYISNHDNNVFRLDGQSIQIVDNGTDRVVFEYKPEYSTLDIKAPSCDEGCNYFEGGFNWQRCLNESLFAKQLIEKTSFAVEEKHNLTADEQRYLLTLHFYSLFFESILEEKPLICFTGVKASGKGLISTAIGKILFGSAFLPSHLPDDLRDFQVSLTENYYLVLDNVDSIVRSPVTDALCRAATGERIAKRKLYTDSDELKIRPRVFLSITSRDPRFKRDDLVDRLIIFNTERIKNPKSRTYLFKQLLAARTALWIEILVNLNSIVALLREKHDWNPPGVFRIADWELWAKKVHEVSKLAHLEELLKKMNKEKARFGLEDDPLYDLLKLICFDRGDEISGLSASELYAKLDAFEEEQKSRDFKQRYKSTMSMAKRLRHIFDELSDEFDFKVVVGHARVSRYYISAKKNGELDGER